MDPVERLKSIVAPDEREQLEKYGSFWMKNVIDIGNFPSAPKPAALPVAMLIGHKSGARPLLGRSWRQNELHVWNGCSQWHYTSFPGDAMPTDTDYWLACALLFRASHGTRDWSTMYQASSEYWGTYKETRQYIGLHELRLPPIPPASYFGLEAQ